MSMEGGGSEGEKILFNGILCRLGHRPGIDIVRLPKRELTLMTITMSSVTFISIHCRGPLRGLFEDVLRTAR